MNRITICAALAILAVLLGALALQSTRVAALKTEVAVMGRDLDQANTRVALLEESEKALTEARDGLTGQVVACQKANAFAQAAAQERRVITKTVRTVPAKPGQVVDDATNARAAAHLNRAAGR